MTLQIELKSDMIVRMGTTATEKYLHIEWKGRYGNHHAYIPMDIVQAFGEVATPQEVIDEVKSE